MIVDSMVKKFKATRRWKELYWANTIIVAFAFVAAGAADVTHVPSVAEGLVRLGYPAYFATILGVWELLGSAAIIVPGLPRLKEWAYAGMFFTLTGAAISHAVTGDSMVHVLVPLALLVVVITSWVLRAARFSGSLKDAQTQRDTIFPADSYSMGVDGDASSFR